MVRPERAPAGVTKDEDEEDNSSPPPPCPRVGTGMDRRRRVSRRAIEAFMRGAAYLRVSGRGEEMESEGGGERRIMRIRRIRRIMRERMGRGM